MQSTAPVAPVDAPVVGMSRDIPTLLDLPIDQIDRNPDQPRRHFAGIEELATSLRERGQLTPVLVRPLGDGRYQLVHGERRWRAAQVAGLATLRAEVRDLDEAEAYRLALVENLQRDDLNAIEEGEAFRRLLAEGMTQAQVGGLVGKTQSYVAQKLRLLNAPACLRELVVGGALTEGHVRELLRLERLHAPGLVCEGIVRPDDPGSGTLFGLPEADYLASTELWEDADALLVVGAFHHLRPEDEPQSTLWLYPWEELKACRHLRTLRRSWVALLQQSEAVADAAGPPEGYPASRDGTMARAQRASLPQWVLAAWWWGCAAVVDGRSVVDLSRILDNWSGRHRSAIVFARRFPTPPDSRSPVPPPPGDPFWKEHRLGWPAERRRQWLPDVTDPEAWRWGHEWDLAHSNAHELLTREDAEARTFVEACLEQYRRSEWIVLPSAFQRWGSEAEAGRRLAGEPADNVPDEAEPDGMSRDMSDGAAQTVEDAAG